MADILMITAIAGADNCAAVLSKQFQLQVETAGSRKDGIAMLRRRDYCLVIVDESLVETCDQPGYEGEDALFRHLGSATPVEVNFATSGAGRLVRAVRSALRRREQERDCAAAATTAAMQTELREAIAGLLLQTQLALSETSLGPGLRARLEVIAGLASKLGQRYAPGQPEQAAHRPVAGTLLPAKPQPALRRQLHAPSPSAESQRRGLLPPPLQPGSRRDIAASARD